MNDARPAETDPPCLLIIAGNDPVGGAGLTADVQTASSLGVHPLPVVTSITVQDTVDVRSVHNVDPALLQAQIACVMDDVPIAAVKLGLLATPELGRVVADMLAGLDDVPIVLDPVLKAGGGGRLAQSELERVLADQVMPLARVATPNGFELERLSPGHDGDVAAAALALADRSGCHVLATGADTAADREAAEVENLLATPGGGIRRWQWPRLPGRYHGSGCTMAAALASALARGHPLERAVDDAQRYTWHALEKGFSPGRGQAIPWRMLE